jgi:hypothetical protein
MESVNFVFYFLQNNKKQNHLPKNGLKKPFEGDDFDILIF